MNTINLGIYLLNVYRVYCVIWETKHEDFTETVCIEDEHANDADTESLQHDQMLQFGYKISLLRALCGVHGVMANTNRFCIETIDRGISQDMFYGFSSIYKPDRNFEDKIWNPSANVNYYSTVSVLNWNIWIFCTIIMIHYVHDYVT